MHALVLTDDGPHVRDHSLTPREGESLIRLELGGVCATDLELVKGYMGFTGVLGHEWVGTVEGSPDANLVGARVVGDINCPCGACFTCHAGRPTHCPNRTVLGIQGRDGASEAAVFVEPLAAACRILEQIHVRPTDRVVVLGLGRLGQLCARVLATTGARVQGVSRNLDRLDLLPDHIEGLGLDDTDRVRGADLVVDATGSADGLSLATSLVRPRGTLALKTTVHDLGDVNPTGWVIDEITIVGSRCGPFEPALRLLASGAIDPTDLITAELPLEQGVEALARAGQRDTVKVLMRP